MLMTRQFTILAALTGLVFVTGPLMAEPDRSANNTDHQAQHDERGRGHDAGGPAAAYWRMVDHLGLDEAQAETVRNILDASRPEFEALRARGDANRAAVRSLDVADPGYDSELQALAAESGQLAADFVMLTGRMRQEVAAVLTEEQREKFERHFARMGERRARSGRSM